MQTTDLELQEDAQSRLRALEHRSFIVEAPAGAGKTELLTQRFLKLMQMVDEPEELIAITFTNKAAAEMRLRILDSLLNADSGIVPSQAHKKITYDLSLAVLEKSVTNGWALLDNPARLRIFTIDGLCAYLARQMPLMSRFGSQPNIAEDPAMHYAAAVEQTLALIDDEAYQAVVIEALRYLDNDTHQLKKLLVRMLSQRDQWLHHARQSVSPEGLEYALNYMVSEELADIAREINAPIQEALMPLARYAASHLACEHSVALLNDWHESLSTNPNSLIMWQSVADLLLTGSGSLRKTITVKDGFPTTGKAQKQAFVELLDSLRTHSNIESALQRIRVLPNLTDHATSWKMIATLSQLLSITAAQLWLVFSQAREVDFIEVSQRAIQALAGEYGEPTDLALRLDYQIKHILVDEFQDTSPSQIELLKQLTQGWQAGDGRTLFLVGDPMQSIYRFRKANVGLFLNAAQDGIGDVTLESLRLYRNNRSSPAVIEWINHTFNDVFPKQDNTAKGAIRYRPFIATKATQMDEGVVVHPIVKLADEPLAQAKQREAQAVIEIILQERAKNPEVKIAILVRAKSHLQAIISTLRRQHTEIPFLAVDIEPLANRQIIQDLLALSRALCHRADRVNWLATLRAPWCGLTLNDLHALAGHDHDSTIWSLMQRDDLAISEDGLTRLAHVNTIFKEAFASQGRVNISRWIRGVWLMLGGAHCLWAKTDVVDVQAFFDCIEALDRNQQFSLTRLETEIDKLFAAPDLNGEALQMMSIHKSKGLEFDVVILPGLGSSTSGQDDQSIVLWEEVPMHAGHAVGQYETVLLAAPVIPKGLKQNSISPYEYINALEKERDQHESARILYVGATRTERKLHLVGIANQTKNEEISPTKNTYLDALWPVVASHYLSHTLELPVTPKEALTIEHFVPKLIRLSHPSIPQLLKIPQEQLEHKQQKQSNSSQRKQDDSASVIANGNSIESEIGTLTHLYLEMMSEQGLATWREDRILSLAQPMQYWFEQLGFVEKIANMAAKKVQTLLITTIQSNDGQWVLQAHESAQAELAMTQMAQVEAKQLVVDRTFIEHVNGAPMRWIIDYKTMDLSQNVSDEVLADIAKKQDFIAQLEGYASLFSHEKLPIKKAIYFVSIGRLLIV